MRSNMRSEFTLNADARSAVKLFRDRKPWKGTVEERLAKFTELHRDLTNAYGMETILVRDDETADPNGSSGSSEFHVATNKIILRGRLSVVTYLWCFAIAAGCNRGDAMKFAKATFKHFFPRSFGGCRHDDELGLIVRDETIRN